MARSIKAVPARETKKKTAAKKTAKTNNHALIIVESPTKAKTLKKYLGDQKPSINVIASGGHVRDLPPKRFGIDVENDFQPEYVLLSSKKRIIKTLTEAAAKAETIYLATDPDREGEAIAWHLSHIFSPSVRNRVHRVQFHEITKRAVLEALRSPGKIDIQKVDAQQARRVVDRLVGYKVSPLLWKTVTGGLSAGRVQSVALRLICEREKEIEDFVKEEYWTIDGLFHNADIETFQAKLHKLDGKKIDITSQEESDEICKRLNDAGSYRISNIKRSRKKRNPAPPYITSTLQQDAARRFGFKVKRTMAIAQKLYEGVDLGERGITGLITYMRTDSTRVSKEANASLREYIGDSFGNDYLNKAVRYYKNKKGAVQDAHEAIRPTDVSINPEDIKDILSPSDFKLYSIIWKRFVATQMSPAEYDVTTVSIMGDDTIEFRASGQVIVFPGYLTVYEDKKNSRENSDDTTTLPVGLKSGMNLELQKLLPKQHFTQPPPRYSEAGLVKELDELGIGRPSTYATIISTLLDRRYVDLVEKAFKPADLGKTVNKILVEQFPDIFNVKFTARMEEELDEIEIGKKWVPVVENFYKPFSESMELAEANRKEIKKNTTQSLDRPCPECGRDLIIRWGKRGKFISCSGFPECKHAESLNPAPPVETDQKCPKCGKPMVVREGRFGRFLGCSDYPKCKGILPISTGYKCPEEGCDGDLIERKTKKGRTFYGCSKYPECKFVSWNAPVEGPCPKCQTPTLLVKKSSKNGDKKYCHRCSWSEEG